MSGPKPFHAPAGETRKLPHFYTSRHIQAARITLHAVFKARSLHPSQLDSSSQGWTPDISAGVNRPYGQTALSELPTCLHLEAETLEATAKILTPNSCPQCLWLESEGQRQQGAAQHRKSDSFQDTCFHPTLLLSPLPVLHPPLFVI